ncbi:hypothetical protein DL769_003822 [Monosporascus sp. CRB-8-3]|nr:hypothetical protein DL769_003822 [Monosporascus sp. CRB-8-3]
MVGETTLPSNIETTPLAGRFVIWKRFQPDDREPEEGYLAGQLLFPSLRNFVVCLADPSDHAKVVEAPGMVARSEPSPGVGMGDRAVCRYYQVWGDFLAWWTVLQVADVDLIQFLVAPYAQLLRQLWHLELRQTGDGGAGGADILVENELPGRLYWVAEDEPLLQPPSSPSGWRMKNSVPILKEARLERCFEAQKAKLFRNYVSLFLGDLSFLTRQARQRIFDRMGPRFPAHAEPPDVDPDAGGAPVVGEAHVSLAQLASSAQDAALADDDYEVNPRKRPRLQ